MNDIKINESGYGQFNFDWKPHKEVLFVVIKKYWLEETALHKLEFRFENQRCKCSEAMAVNLLKAFALTTKVSQQPVLSSVLLVL